MKGRIIGVAAKTYNIKVITYFGYGKDKFLAYINDSKKAGNESIRLGIVKNIEGKIIVFKPENDFQYNEGLKALESLFNNNKLPDINVFSLDDIHNIDLISANDTGKKLLDYQDFFINFVFVNSNKAGFLKDIEDPTALQNVTLKENIKPTVEQTETAVANTISESSNGVVSNQQSENITEQTNTITNGITNITENDSSNVISNAGISSEPIDVVTNRTDINNQEAEPLKPTKKKPNMLVIVIFLIILLLGVGAYLFKDSIIGLFKSNDVPITEPIIKNNTLTCSISTNDKSYDAVLTSTYIYNFTDKVMASASEISQYKFSDAEAYNKLKQTVDGNSDLTMLGYSHEFDDANMLYKLTFKDESLIDKTISYDQLNESFLGIGYKCNDIERDLNTYKNQGIEVIKEINNLEYVKNDSYKISFSKDSISIDDSYLTFNVDVNKLTDDGINNTLIISLYDGSKKLIASEETEIGGEYSRLNNVSLMFFPTDFTEGVAKDVKYYSINIK